MFVQWLRSAKFCLEMVLFFSLIALHGSRVSSDAYLLKFSFHELRGFCALKEAAALQCAWGTHVMFLCVSQGALSNPLAARLHTCPPLP